MVTLMFTGLKLLGHQLARMKLDEKENIVSRFLISTISTISSHCYNISTVCRFQDGFKQMWINNGNTLSKLYAGTAALCSVGIKLSGYLGWQFYAKQAHQMFFITVRYLQLHVNVTVSGRV